MSKQDRQGVRTATDLERKYNFGRTFADVYGLIADVQKVAEEANKAIGELDHEKIFNLLTNNGAVKGIYREGDEVYVNASYIKSGKLAADYIDATDLKVNAANIVGKLTANQIESQHITVTAANVTGTLTSNQIRLGGEMAVYQTATGSDVGGYVGYVTGMGYNGEITTGMGMMSTDGTNQMVVTSGGARVSSATAEFLAAYHAWVQTTGNIYLNADGYISDSSGDAITSDRNSKENILYDVDEKYLAIFDGLKPCSFRYIGRNRQHLGFIAQEVEEAMIAAGVDGDDYATVINDEGQYSLRYSEFIPLIVAKIKQLERKMRA